MSRQTIAGSYFKYFHTKKEGITSMKLRTRSYTGTRNRDVTQRELDHGRLAREAAAEGIVLLKNEDHLLPIPAGSRIGLYGAGA